MIGNKVNVISLSTILSTIHFEWQYFYGIRYTAEEKGIIAIDYFFKRDFMLKSPYDLKHAYGQRIWQIALS